ncbi:hypothetical protein HMPREF1982_03978 [Clostridiales bacterium oral taxon 876 str. F0540]|nr:hypothetical protein HMPREF1982_03978 [Clostridiales bacterium oral taxon 876 str. F0540]
MELSFRLKSIASLMEKCDSMADIGTDHAYIPIYLVKEGLCKRAIASDINKGPVEKALKNIIIENLEDKIQCRLGGGFSTIAPKEVECAVIAGMGGNLIRDIVEEGIDVFKELDYCVFQPVQNPDVLREYIYSKGFTILEEDLCIDEGKFYEIIKVRYDNNKLHISPIYYEVGKRLLEKKHPLVNQYINLKLEKYYKIYNSIADNTSNAKARKAEVLNKIDELKELLINEA